MDIGQTLKFALLIALGLLSVGFIYAWLTTKREEKPLPSWTEIAVGFGANFLDTLGIGSFATTTSVFKLLRMVRDELIPGTLLAGHTLPVMAQAFIFMTVVKVDPWLLVTMIAASLTGAWIGAGIVSGLPRRAIQIGMGAALLIAALFMVMTQFGWFPEGGAGLALSGGKWLFALAMNFVFGVLMTLGIGNYAPSLMLFSLLGMDPLAAFPVMMGSGAFGGGVSGIRFIGKGRFDWRAALGLMLGGIPAVFIAAFIVKSLPLKTLRWVVFVIVVYTALAMLRSALMERRLLLNEEAEAISAS